MRTLILSDERFDALTAALAATPEGEAVLASFEAEPPKLPPPAALVALARERDSEPPPAIVLARAHRDAGRQAAADTREHANALLVRCYRAGVGPTTLSRWFGFRPRRVYEIIQAGSK